MRQAAEPGILKAMRVALVLLMFILVSCGSSQPTGELDSCTGNVRVTEDYTDVSFSATQNLGTGARAAQYVRFRRDIVTSEMMLRAFSTTSTAIKIAIYKGRLTDVMGADNPPLKEFTVTQGVSTNSDFEMWLKFPEPFDFQATTEAEASVGLFYFITFEPVDGSVSLVLSSRDTISRMREGIRFATNSNPPWLATDTTKAFGMGFLGKSDCKTL